MDNVYKYNLFIAPFIAGWGLYRGLWYLFVIGVINWTIGCLWGRT